LELLRAGHHNLRSVMVTAVKRAPRRTWGNGCGPDTGNAAAAAPAYTVAFIPRYALQVGLALTAMTLPNCISVPRADGDHCAAGEDDADHRRRCDGRAGQLLAPEQGTEGWRRWRSRPAVRICSMLCVVVRSRWTARSARRRCTSASGSGRARPGSVARGYAGWSRLPRQARGYPAPGPGGRGPAARRHGPAHRHGRVYR